MAGSSIFASLFRRAPSTPAPTIHLPFTVATNPYRCKRTWPPDFSKLSRQHQFRLERRYRRRTKLKWARPTWNKTVQLAQWASILFVVVYGVLFLDIGEGGQEKRTPFDGIRRWYWEQMSELKGARDGAELRQRGTGAGEQKG